MIVLHFKTERDQPRGTVSRVCAECGATILVPPIPIWTDDHHVWLAPPDGYVNCRDNKKP